MVDEILFSSKDTNWRTPMDFFMKLDEEFSFELDAAASEQNTLCSAFYDEEDDSLGDGCPWHTYGSVFVNPPYGRGIGAWVEKAWRESQKGCTVVMLLPARTDTEWFHEYVYHRAEIRLLKGRIRFLDNDGKPLNAAPFPSMLAIYRPPSQRSM